MALPTAVLIATATSIAATSTITRIRFPTLNGSPPGTLHYFPQRLKIAACADFYV